MFSTTSGFDDRTQKNQVRPAEVVSLPAKMKLVMISLRNSVEFSSYPINRDNKSSPWLSYFASFLDCMIFSA